jgi:hypothetical protein
MSPANVDYIIKHNPQLKREKLEIAPNSYSLKEDQSKNLVDIIEIRRKYNLPIDKPIFIYGGNMGKPQGVPFVIECLRAIKDRNLEGLNEADKAKIEELTDPSAARVPAKEAKEFGIDPNSALIDRGEQPQEVPAQPGIPLPEAEGVPQGAPTPDINALLGGAK